MPHGRLSSPPLREQQGGASDRKPAIQIFRQGVVFLAVWWESGAGCWLALRERGLSTKSEAIYEPEKSEAIHRTDAFVFVCSFIAVVAVGM